MQDDQTPDGTGTEVTGEPVEVTADLVERFAGAVGAAPGEVPVTLAATPRRRIPSLGDAP